MTSVQKCSCLLRSCSQSCCVAVWSLAVSQKLLFSLTWINGSSDTNVISQLVWFLVLLQSSWLTSSCDITAGCGHKAQTPALWLAHCAGSGCLGKPLKYLQPPHISINVSSALIGSHFIWPPQKWPAPSRHQWRFQSVVTSCVDAPVLLLSSLNVTWKQLKGRI